jgi:hypothetical protein
MGMVDYRPLAFGLMLTGVGALGAILAPAYSLVAFSLILISVAIAISVPTEDRLYVLWVLGLLLLFRMSLLAALHLVSKAHHYHGFLFGDGRLYFNRAYDLFAYLKGLRDFPFDVSYGVNGYVYLSGFTFGLARPSVFMVKTLNVCVSIAASFGFYLWVRGEFGRRAGLSVFTILSLWPSIQYWSLSNLKEPHIIFILMIALWSAYRLFGGERHWSLWIVALVGAVALLMTYNKYLAFTLAFSLAVGWLLGRYPRQVALASASALAGGVWLYLTEASVKSAVSNFLLEWVVIPQDFIVRSDFAGYVLYPYDPLRGLFPYHFGLKGEIYWSNWLTSFFKGLFYFLFSPFPWGIKSFGQFLTYPQILLWYALFPFVLYGAWVLLKTKFRRILPVIVFVISTTILLALTSGNVGQALRHRDWISPFCLVFSVVGILSFLKEPGLLARLRTCS